ncbi:hypothetical protein ACHWQZ_G017770 [Mnemiopsis leidyi]
MDVDHEIELLKEKIKLLGVDGGDGTWTVKFGVLFNDTECANLFEALVGTLRAAKKRKVVTFQGQMLLSPTHDDVDVKLLVA